MAMIIFLIASLFIQGTFAELVCEQMPIDKCTFSISSSAKRCLLETNTAIDGNLEYQCKTSEVEVMKFMPEWIESDKCIDACGVDRYSIGISSDSLMESGFTAMLCAPACYQNCPNIVDLFYNLALGEGAFLPDLCKSQQYNPHRVMTQMLSSGDAASDTASGPASVSADVIAVSPSSYFDENEHLSIASAPTLM